jgi:uncharacterized delta-60 repeat protein
MPRRPVLVRAELLEDRLAPHAGDLDLSFGDQGKATVPDLTSVTAMVDLPDGRIVAIGPYQSGPSNTDFGVVRLTANGDPDPTFGTNGLATIGFDVIPNGADYPAAIELRPDGGVVMAGSAATSGSATEAALAVLTRDGKPDPAFNTDGKISFPLGDGVTPSAATAVRVLADGSILVAGTGTVASGHVVAAAKLRPAGTFDTGYGTGGEATTPPDVGSDARAEISPDGGVLALTSHEVAMNSQPSIGGNSYDYT